ncbi:hypothetical protein [Janibacter indicus]|uniref:hypothetical protein n=1 Tax=Janibacter indicus TaxID=857417 RepID=UPI003EBD2F52
MASGRHPLRPRGAPALLLALLVLAGLAVPPASAAPQDEGGPRDVVVIGAPGLSWSDVTEEGAPAITSFAKGAALANLNVRSTYFTSCPSDGWLGLSAGTRAAEPRDVTRAQLRADPRALPTCSALPQVDSSSDLTTVEMDPQYWADLSQRISQQGFDAQIGTLGETAEEAGVCVSGSGPGSVLATVDHAGGGWSGRAGINEPCPITLVGAPAITVPDGVRAQQVAAVDRTVADVVASVDGDTVVILAGLSDDGGKPGLRVLAMHGADVEPGWLHSDSTTRDEMAQVADVTHTTLALAGLTPPDRVTGRMLVPVPDDGAYEDRRASLVDDDAQLRAADEVIPPFFRGFGLGLAGLLVIAGLGGALGPRSRRPVVRRAVGVVALAAMAVPASTYLLTLTRWFDTPSAMGGFVLRLAVIDLALLALVLVVVLLVQRRWPGDEGASGGPWRAALVAVGTVAGVTWGLLAVDLLLGGRMTMLSVLGLLPLDGGRFHGFGNVPFAIFVAAAFFLMAALASPFVAAGRRRTAALVVAVVGGATFVVDAWLGADGGGALALIPSVGYLVLAVAGVRLGWGKVLTIGVATVVGFLAMAGLDWLRPEESRTHLGRFFGSLLAGDAWGILVRKLETNVDLLLGPERTALLVPVVLVAVIWVLARPDSAAGQRIQPVLAAYPALRVGLIGLVVALTVGFLLNDSGTAIPAAAALVLAPALLVLRAGAGD